MILFLGIFLSVLLTVAPAHADPLGVIVTGLAGVLGGGALGTTIARTVVGIALYFGVNYLSRQLAGEPKPQGISGTFNSGGIVPRSFVLGRMISEGSLVYHGTWKQDDNTPNEYYTRVTALSDMPISGVAELWIDGKKRSYTSGGSQSGLGQVISDYTVDGKPHMWVIIKDGTQGSVDPLLVQKFGTHPKYPIDSNFIGTGVAYAIVTMRANEELYQGFPEFRFVVDGIKLYDPRKDSTISGGSGSHRWNTKSTWEFSRNPVVMIYNILMGLTQSGSWFYGLQKMVQARLPPSNWFAAMNECDEDVSLNAGGSEKRYRAGMEVNVDVQPVDTIERLLSACNGRLAETGGYYKPWVGPAGSAVLSITDDDIAITDEQTFSPFFGLGEAINGVTASFTSPAEGWVLKDVKPRYNSTYEQEDDDRRLLADVTFDMVTSGSQTQRLMKAALRESRRARRHTFVLTGAALILEPIDFISWTSTRNGYSSKLFRIDGITYRNNLDTLVDITEVDPSDYDWTFSSDEDAVPDGEVDVDVPVTQLIKDWNAVGLRVPGTGGRELPGIRFSWDGTMGDIRGVRFQVRLATNQALIRDDTTESYDAGGLDITGNINSATDYQVRGKFIPKSSRKTDWGNWINVTTPDTKILAVQLDTQTQLDLNRIHGNAADSLNTALTRINELAAEIDTKNHVFYQTTAPVSTPTIQLAEGDLWFDSDDSNRQYRYSGTTWVVVASSVGLKTYYQAAAPTTGLTTGDLWIDSDDENKLYRWSGLAWVLIRDTGIATNANLLLQETTNRVTGDTAAYNAINGVQSRFNVKSRVYVQGTAPTTGPTITVYSGNPPVASSSTEPLVDGDLWFDSDDGNRQYRRSAGAWVVLPDGNKNRIFVQPTAPAANTVGLALNDIWIDSDGAPAVSGVEAVPVNTMYRWNGSAWAIARDQLIDTVRAEVATEASTRTTRDAAMAKIMNTVWTEVGKLNAGGFMKLEADLSSTKPPDVIARFTVYLNVGSVLGAADPVFPRMDENTGAIERNYSAGSSSFSSAGFFMEIYDANWKSSGTWTPSYKSRVMFDVDTFVIGKAGSTSKKRPFKYSSSGLLQVNEISVDVLSSLTQNAGTINAGIIQSNNGKVHFDLNAGQLLFFE